MQNTSIQDIMTTHIVTVNRNEIVSKVVEIFKEHSFHHLPVVNDEGLLKGLISKTDMDRSISGVSHFKNDKKAEYDAAIFRSMRACEIMTENTITLEAKDSIRSAYNIFKENKFRALPILSEGQLVGMLTPIDILDHFFS